MHERQWLLLAALLSLSAVLTHCSVGWAQLGMRYWILAYPFLLTLMAKGPLDQFAKILVIASIVLMLYMMWFFRIYRPF